MTTDEQDFLDRYDAEAFDRPSLTVDAVLLTVRHGALHVLVVRRQSHPFHGQRAVPGGFVRIDEPLDRAAQRIVSSKTGLGDDIFLEQLYTFGSPGRDPRTRVVTVAYVALVDDRRLRGATLSADAEVLPITVDWPDQTGGPVHLHDPTTGAEADLAFDHADIIGMAVKRLRGKIDYAPIGFQLLPEHFTLLHLQRVHETVSGQATNKDSFRRRMLASGQLEATGERERDVGHRPAELYRFTRRSAT